MGLELGFELRLGLGLGLGLGLELDRAVLPAAEALEVRIV